MGHYKSNLRDIEFNLFEVLALDKALASGAYGDLTSETARELLTEAAHQAEGPLAEPFAEADRQPPVFDPATHSVKLPDAFKAAVRFWQDGQWSRIGLHEGVGGIPAPPTLTWAINEFLVGSQPAVFMYLVGPAMLDVLYRNGTEQQQHWASLGVQRNWGATMVLTEPEAGSDVGAARTKAAGRRCLAHRRCQTIHHLCGLRRPVRKHRPPCAGPTRRRGSRY